MTATTAEKLARRPESVLARRYSSGNGDVPVVGAHGSSYEKHPMP